HRVGKRAGQQRGVARLGGGGSAGAGGPAAPKRPVGRRSSGCGHRRSLYMTAGQPIVDNAAMAPYPDEQRPDLPSLDPGWVWLAGAGPGEAGLLTLLAWHGLRQADAVVYDALVDESVLRLAPPGAELIHAGKRGGKPSPT